MNRLKINVIAKQNWWMLGLLLVMFPIVYGQLFKASFISWDDADVLLKNKDVHTFNIKAFFTKHYVGNYAPITMIGFAIDWLLFHGSSFWQHAVNVFFHFINALLVLVFAYKLLNNKWLAFLVCIVFSFHPTQIETVAWVAAKNNLMYAFFFLLGLICYVNYQQTKAGKFYWFALVLFILSVLSKPSAISFPLCLIAIDYFLNQRLIWKDLINKLPFFLLALVFGLVTIYSRTEDKFINESHAFAIYERVGFAGYAVIQYFIKFLFPVNLSVIYPYPQDKLLTVVVGYFVWVFIGMIVYLALRREKKNLMFALSFFIINLLLVLQFIPFGEVLTADRYMYLPIIGLTLVLFSLFKSKESIIKPLSLGLIIILGILSFKRSAVWKNSISLYSDIIDKYPHSFLALNSLGAEYMLNKNYVLSERYLNKAIGENQNYYKGYYNRGLMYAQTNRMPEAVADFSKSIELKQYLKAYVARANVYYLQKDFPKAIADAEIVLKSESTNSKANFVIANCYDDLNKLDQALVFYNRAIESNQDPTYYLRRAILFGKQKEFSKCLEDLNTATVINPQYGEAYYWKGVVKVNLKQSPCDDLMKAINLGFDAARQPLANYCR